MKPLLLALSTCRQADLLVRKTIEIARQEARNVIVLFVVDTCREFALIDSQTIVGTHFRQTCRDELLAECCKMAEATVNAIASQIIEAGVSCETLVTTGRFYRETVDTIEERQPEKLILARSWRPRWIRTLFGFSGDGIYTYAHCQVLEVRCLPTLHWKITLWKR